MRLEKLVSAVTLAFAVTLLSGCTPTDLFMLVFAGAVPRTPTLDQGATPRVAVFNRGVAIPIGIVLTNPGPGVTGDLFGGVVLAPQSAPSVACPPDSTTGFALAIQFVFGENRTRCVSDVLARPQDLVPLRNVTVPGALPETTLTPLFTFTPTEPGNYTAFIVFTPPGAFQGGKINVFYHAAAMTTFQVLP